MSRRERVIRVAPDKRDEAGPQAYTVARRTPRRLYVVEAGQTHAFFIEAQGSGVRWYLTEVEAWRAEERAAADSAGFYSSLATSWRHRLDRARARLGALGEAPILDGEWES